MKNSLRLQFCPHPFAVERIDSTAAAGESIETLAALVQPDALLLPHLHAFLNGDVVERHNWPRVFPKAGTVLTFRMVPLGGGGGKNPLRTLLSLALLAASPALSAGLMAALGPIGGISIVGRLVTTGIGILGRLALNALAPPGRARYASQKESPTLFIQGAQNRATPFGRVPKVLGRHRFVPPFGALPYTETAGSDQYLRLLFIWGYGPLHITDLKIGETPLSEFEGVEIETREGYADDAPLTLYTNSVLQNDLSINATAAAGYITRTTETDADEISLDITLPRGLVKFGAKGGRISQTVRIEVQYAPAGTSDWSAGRDDYKAFPIRSITLPAPPQAHRRRGVSTAVTRSDRIIMDSASGDIAVLRGTDDADAPAGPAGKISLALVERHSDGADVLTDTRDAAWAGNRFETPDDFAVTAGTGSNVYVVAAGGLQFPGIEITGKQTAALRQALTFKVPRGQYDVRIRRVTEDAGDNDKIFDETSWTALRTIRYAAPVNMPGLAMTALRIKATDQLSGVIDRFNGVVTSILPDWTGEDWVEQPTANPASLFRHVLQGSANARPLNDSRLDLDKITQWHDRCTAANREFNAVIDYDASVREVLHNVAAAGRASPALIDGKWGVVEDMPQTVPVQHFTPRNSFNFQGRKAFADVPDALRVRFINRAKGWVQDERIVYADGKDTASAQRFETLDLAGITDAGQAWRDGRYHAAAALLRPEIYSFSCDIEHIVCTRGDLIRFTHDVPMFGICSARIKTLVAEGGMVTALVLDDGATMEDSKAYALRCRKADGASQVLPLITLAGSSPTLTLQTPLAVADAPEAGDLCMFGEAGRESVELIVKSITPQGNLAAKLECVDAAPAIHMADSGTVPEFSSQLTLPPELQRPPVPVLAQIQSGAEVLVRNTDGSLTTRIVLTLVPPAFGQAVTIRAAIRAKDESTFHTAEMTTANSRVSITDVAEGESYDLQLRYIGANGLSSPPLAITGHRVTGTADIPSDVAGLPDLDLDHYALRYSPALEDASWSSAVDVISSIARDATAITVPFAAGSYLLKAVDVGGRASENAALAVTSVAGGGQNAVLEIIESPNFTGTKTNMVPRDGALQLAGKDNFDDKVNVDAIGNMDIGPEGLFSEGSYEFAATPDLGAVYTSRLTAVLSVFGVDLNSTVDTWGDIDAIENFEQSVDPSLWQLRLQLRSTADDSGATPVWTAWTDFVIADYTARAFQFRLLAAAANTNISPAVSALAVTIDMPDRIASARALAADAAGLTVAYDTAFRAVPSLLITPHDMASGDYYTLTAQDTAGFNICFYNSAGSGIARTFDYQSRGFGSRS